MHWNKELHCVWCTQFAPIRIYKSMILLSLPCCLVGGSTWWFIAYNNARTMWPLNTRFSNLELLSRLKAVHAGKYSDLSVFFNYLYTPVIYKRNMPGDSVWLDKNSFPLCLLEIDIACFLEKLINAKPVCSKPWQIQSACRLYGCDACRICSRLL